MLKMFQSEVDFVIAETEEEAKEFGRQAWRDNGSMEDNEEQFDEMAWTVMDMDKSFTFDKEGIVRGLCERCHIVYAPFRTGKANER